MAGDRGPGATRSAPAGDDGAASGGLRGLIRRIALAAVAPELQLLEMRVEAASTQAARLSERAAACERGLGSLVGRLEEAVRLADARLAVLEAPGEPLEDVREITLALRAELELLRDRRVPGLEQRLDDIADNGVGALQREIEALRDERVPGIEQRLDTIAGANVAALQAEVETLRDERVPRLEAAADAAQAAIDAVQNDLAEARDTRLGRVETDLGSLHGAVTGVQASLGDVRDRRLPELARDVEALQLGQEGVQRLAEEVRDRRLPALAGRVDALLATLHEELTATAGLVDRITAEEPLRVQVDPTVEAALPGAFWSASAAFMDAFRGGTEEIAGRVGEYVSLLRDAAPVLDVGCGRGELLAQLADTGIESIGIDGDPAMVETCRRRGLSASRADLLEFLRGAEPGTYGAITAIHVFEHLPAAVWMCALEAAARALRSGGLLVVECPNPEALRVGAALFWIDPTHRAPLHPDSLGFVLKAIGFEVVDVLYRRPFPAEQLLADEAQSPEVRRLAERLDAWLSGPRDFAVIARKH